ncbi:corrinoid protein [Oscillospiraceae bacterium PP1C4]
MPSNFEEISKFLQQGRAPAVKEQVAKAIEEGCTAIQILENGLLAGMNIIGEKFKNNQVFIPEVMIAARAMNTGLELLKPLLAEAGVENKGTVIIGTVKGDLHDIGKNLVKMMLEGKGLKVIDLGVDVPAAKYVAAAQQNSASIICCSALLTTTMNEMKNVVELVKSSPLAGTVKVMIGGAPVTQSFCDAIGADSYTPDAATAAEVALGFCS